MPRCCGRRQALSLRESSDGASSVTAGAFHTCAIAGSALKCWGLNTDLALGAGLPDTQYSLPQDVALGAAVVQVEAGPYHTCAVVSGGVSCWGDGTRGQLGNGTWPASPSGPVQVLHLEGRATQVTVGMHYVCATMAEGGGKCWGDNTSGRQGQNMSSQTGTPTHIAF